MRNFLRNLVASAGLALSMLAVGVISSPLVYAQTAPPASTSQRQPVPRYYQTQQVAYVRTTFAFNSACTLVTATCTAKLTNASLPYNAILLRATFAVYTAFNSTTSDTISIGTTSANGNELVSAANVHATGLVSGTVVTPGSVTTALGNGTAQSGFNGGFDLFLKWVAGTGGTATTGLVSIILEYVPANDGLCAPVPLGSTATGC